MKTLLIYYSKQQSTFRCMEYLASSTKNSTLSEVSIFKGKLIDYDHIIIGTPIYMGAINKLIKQFILDNEETLLKKQLSIVVCAMNLEVIEETLQNNFNDSIKNHALIVHAGGSYDFTKLNFFERLIVKKIAKVSESIDDIRFDSLDLIINK